MKVYRYVLIIIWYVLIPCFVQCSEQQRVWQELTAWELFHIMAARQTILNTIHTTDTVLFDKHKKLLDINKELLDKNQGLLDTNQGLLDKNKELLDKNKRVHDQCGQYSALLRAVNKDCRHAEQTAFYWKNQYKSCQKRLERVGECVDTCIVFLLVYAAYEWYVQNHK